MEWVKHSFLELSLLGGMEPTYFLTCKIYGIAPSLMHFGSFCLLLVDIVRHIADLISKF